jgi:ribosomal protein S18 acetylase RimI-like enzyme
VPSKPSWPGARLASSLNARIHVDQALTPIESGSTALDQHRGYVEVDIRRGLPAYLRAEAAALFDEAFGDKLSTALPSSELRGAALERTLRSDHIVAALHDGELLGMVGLSAAHGRYQGGVIATSEVFSELRALLGLLGATRAVVGLAMGQHRPEKDELYVDGIAVSSAARGQGIGSRLLGEVTTIAREDGFRWVRLDVVDTNPRAQQLYDRLGYKVTKVQTFRYMRRFIGFGGMVSMELGVRDQADLAGMRD